MNKWNTEFRTGAWLNIGGVRFVGTGYPSNHEKQRPDLTGKILRCLTAG